MIVLSTETRRHFDRTAKTLIAISECLSALSRGDSAIFRNEDGSVSVIDKDTDLIAFLSRFTHDSGMSLSVFCPLVAGEVTYRRRVLEAERERAELWDVCAPDSEADRVFGEVAREEVAQCKAPDTWTVREIIEREA